jgi:tetratricopeptide (TPR) repeat protein
VVRFHLTINGNNSFDQNNTASGFFEIQNEIVKSILTAVGGYYGTIFRDVMKALSHVNDIEIYDGIFLYYHQKVFTKEVYQKTIIALEAAVKLDPNYALAWAMLGELYMDDKAMEFVKTNDPLEKALECALRAIAIEPTCQPGYMALSWVYLFHQNLEECLKAVDRCIAINPNFAEKTAAMGFVLICAGEFERGFTLLNHSVQHNPFSPWWYRVAFVFYFLKKKNTSKPCNGQ